MLAEQEKRLVIEKIKSETSALDEKSASVFDYNMLLDEMDTEF